VNKEVDPAKVRGTLLRAAIKEAPVAGNFKQILGPKEGKSASRRRTPFEDLFFGGDPLRGLFAPVSTTASVGTEILRTDDGFLIEVPVPGFSGEQVEVTVHDNTLMVSGTSERRNFTRSFLLPDEIDIENIDASVDNGLLTLQLHRRPQHEPRRIQVRLPEATTRSVVPYDELLNIHATQSYSDTMRSTRFYYAQETVEQKNDADGVLQANL
jgi:HSP20 family protein